MELIVIDETKLKIMLTPPDMRHYELSCERMTTSSPATRRAFRHIFDDAREQIGFETAGQRLLVQLYTSHEGGCEIFVTKLGAKDLADEYILPSEGEEAEAGEIYTDMSDGAAALLDRLRGERTAVRRSASAKRAEAGAFDSEAETETIALRFGSMEDLIALCRRLLSTGYAGESDLYIADRKAGWYLFLTDRADLPHPPYLSEYAARPDDAHATRLMLCERGRCLCTGNAVARMGNL